MEKLGNSLERGEGGQAVYFRRGLGDIVRRKYCEYMNIVHCFICLQCHKQTLFSQEICRFQSTTTGSNKGGGGTWGWVVKDSVTNFYNSQTDVQKSMKLNLALIPNLDMQLGWKEPVKILFCSQTIWNLWTTKTKLCKKLGLPRRKKPICFFFRVYFSLSPYISLYFPLNSGNETHYIECIHCTGLGR